MRVSPWPLSYIRCFQFRPHLHVWRSSLCFDGLSQWWRLPSSAILSVPHRPCSSGFAWGHQLVMVAVCAWLMAVVLPSPPIVILNSLESRSRGALRHGLFAATGRQDIVLEQRLPPVRKKESEAKASVRGIEPGALRETTWKEGDFPWQATFGGVARPMQLLFPARRVLTCIH